MTLEIKDGTEQTGGVSIIEAEEVIKAGHPPMANKVVLIDFDGTLYPFGFLFDGPAPLPGAVKFVQLLNKKGYKIGIFTSRLNKKWLRTVNQSYDDHYRYIMMICKRDKIPYNFITAEKRPAERYYDDKAIQFTSWDRVPMPDSIYPVDKIAWAAGFFDGEGCIGIYAYNRDSSNSGGGQYGSLTISISQVDRKPLDSLFVLFGGSIHLNENHTPRPIFQWKLNSRKAKPFLEEILPYLVVKKEQAILALEFISTLRDGATNNFQNPLNEDEKEKRLRIINQLKNLKHGIEIDDVSLL